MYNFFPVSHCRLTCFACIIGLDIVLSALQRIPSCPFRRAAWYTTNSRRSDLANERLPVFEPTDDGNYAVIPAPSMRRRGSNDLEELGMEIRRLEEEVDNYDANVNVPVVQQPPPPPPQPQQQHSRRTERVVETRRKVTTKRTMSSKRYEGK